MKVKWSMTTTGICNSIDDIPSGSKVIEIDGEEVHSFCEACNKPLFENSEIHSDDEGVDLCKECYQDFLREQ